MIVLWGLPADPPIAEVARALTAARVEHFLLDQRRAPVTRAELVVDGRTTGWLAIGDHRLDLAEVKAWPGASDSLFYTCLPFFRPVGSS